MRLTIKSRLQLALNLVIVSMSTLAAAGMLLLVSWFEDTLFYNHLQSDLTDLISHHQGITEPLVLPMTDTVYYKLPKNDQSLLPEAFRDYPQGAHEILLPNKAYNLFVHNESGWKHVLVQDQSEFERYELLVFIGVSLGVLLIWMLGFGLSRHLSRQILQPISQLASEVASLPQQTGNRLERHYPNDETGQLARSFDHYVLQVNELLLREQQFAANASHELRTPMMVIRGALDMLAESEVPPAIARQLQRVDGALGQMQQQTELFLQLSRTPDSLSGNNELSPLAELAAAQLAHWQPLADNQGLQLTLEVIEQAPPQPANMMVAVLNNLLRNAIQHTASGGITVTITAHYLRVSDTGSGMSDELQIKARERGVNVANPAGYGLGLAIIERICEHQGWRLILSSPQHSGTQATIYFAANEIDDKALS
ncbi:sensor histidine kinase [Shewanella algidipiscicola]|uniref:histidine kinase n=1 Tax=Shewanella algidipiscicola TaxID=614070 RepID=A0ABQ4NT28_9GAMM|nr:HAMP domain-containing sensor histidine kinase [Shewanella algidipiscicola]GIU02617.1 two-component sensor histidine kinase [Shewanella algidipiscicola]